MALMEKIVALENDAEQFGFRWETTDQIVKQIQSECAEIEAHLTTDFKNNAALQEEIGDLLHAAFSLCVFCQFNPEETLRMTLSKFERRLNAVKVIAHQKGFSHLNGKTFEELMSIWEEAKIQVG